MKRFLQHIWSLSGLVAALAVLLTFVSTDVSWAHPSMQGEDVPSQEMNLDVTYFGSHGTLNGLTINGNALAVAAGQSEGVYESDEIQTTLNSVSDIVPLWKANIANDADLLIETRLHMADGSWSGWEANPYAFFPARNDEFAGNLIWVGGQKVGLQVRVTLRGLSTLESVSLVFSDNSNGPSDSDIAAQKADAEIAAETCPLPQPVIVSRTEWGNPHGQGSRLAPRYAPVTHIIIHQSETPNTLGWGQDYAGVVRSVWNFHARILRWGDTGYNFMIDPNGVIYEGRAGNFDEDGVYEAGPNDGDVAGIHDTHNVGSMAIGFLGCYGSCDNPHLSVAEPSDAMLDSAVELMSWKLDQNDIDPQSRSNYDGLRNIPVIAGGRDVSWTSSPGRNLYNKLGYFRDAVAEQVPCELDATPTPTTEPVTPTPTSDGNVTPTPGTPVATITPTSELPTATPVVPTATPTVELLSCQVTDVVFDKNQYAVGDKINLTLKLADANGKPLGGANVDVQVVKTVDLNAQAFSGIGFLDRAGEYDGSYDNTNVAGSYRFNFQASDPTGTRFAPCTAEKFVLVVGTTTTQPTATPVGPTATPSTPVVTVTVTATAVTPVVTETPVTPVVTETPATPTQTPVTPVVTETPTTPTPTPVTPTPTPIVTPLANSLGFAPVCSEFGAMTIEMKNAVNIRGVDMEIKFDPSVAQVDSLTENAAFFSSPTNGVVAVKTFDNTTGIIKFAASVLGSNMINGTQDLLTINWKAGSGGPSQVLVQNLTLVDDNDVKITVNAGTVDPGYVATDCNNTTLGSVALQGRSNNSGIIITTNSGRQIESGMTGNFVLVGESVASISYPGYLSGQVVANTGVRSSDTAGNSMLNVGRLTLLAGDVNQDNKINIFDLTYLASRFNGSDLSADLNQDGKVNIFDLSLAASNYSKQGPLTEWK